MNRYLLAAAMAALSAPPALAQEPDAIFSAYEAKAKACLGANSDKAIQQEARLSLCQQDVAQVDAFFAERTASPHERNIYHMVRGFLQIEIGGAYLKLDGVRSARVCAQTEVGWAELARIVDEKSPPGAQADFKSMRTGVGKAITACRTEFGTPVGAPPGP